jgi:tetratricopeptide (TPR) repeat protein
MITDMLRRYSRCVAFLLVFAGSFGMAQSGSKPALDFSATAEKATRLAENGHCDEALPTLRKALGQVKDKELRHKVSIDGARCAMTLHQSDAALTFLSVLQREFPGDPDALYVAIHAYSDLSTEASQELARTAPSSFQAHELLAESYEAQGKWEQAEKEYRGIAAQNPTLPGIHFRIGRLLLSKANPSSDVAAEAKREFAEELTIDSSNAAAEYVLGELARQDQSWDDAIAHFSKAGKLDPQFSEAFLGLGISYIAAKRYADAVAPLETAVKLDPRNPNAHYQLGTAYTRAGRKEEGQKEFAIHQKLIGTQGGQIPAAAANSPDSQQ